MATPPAMTPGMRPHAAEHDRRPGSMTEKKNGKLSGLMNDTLLA